MTSRLQVNIVLDAHRVIDNLWPNQAEALANRVLKANFRLYVLSYGHRKMDCVLHGEKNGRCWEAVLNACKSCIFTKYRTSANRYVSDFYFRSEGRWVICSNGGKGETAKKLIWGPMVFVDDNVHNLLDVGEYFPHAVLVLADAVHGCKDRESACALEDGRIVRLCKWKDFLVEKVYVAKANFDGDAYNREYGDQYISLCRGEHIRAHYIGHTESYSCGSWTALIVDRAVGWVPSAYLRSVDEYDLWDGTRGKYHRN